jgi:hypothetical protein
MNRILITLLLITVFSLSTQAQQKRETIVFKFIAGKDMFFLRGNEAELKRLYRFVDQYRLQIRSGEIPIYVDSYCTSLDNWRSNLRVAYLRASRVKSELITVKKLKEEDFKTKLHPEGKNRADEVLVSFHLPPVPSEKAEEKARPNPEVAPRQPVEQPQPAEQPQPVEQALPETNEAAILPPATENRKDFSLRTNLLYWAVALPNLGVEWKPSESTGILLNGAQNHWVWSDENKQYRTWLLQPEIRRYFGENRQWFAGVEGHIGELNFKFDDTGYQGNVLGGGIIGGYHLRLSKRCDMDFSLGLGYTQLKYETYYRSNNVIVHKKSNMQKNIFAPTQAGVSLIFKL